MTCRARFMGLGLLASLFLSGVASAADPAIEEAEQLLADWQLEDAMAIAQRLLQERPEDPEVWVLAARVQYERGEHLSALALFDAAIAEGVDQESIGYVYELVKSTANYAAHFDTLETNHFKIRYLNKDEIVATYAAPVLEAAYEKIGGDLGLKPAERGEKIAVEIFPDARGLAGATGLTVEQIQTSGTIAVCKFHRLMITSPLATADGYGWADTIAHEFVHLVISKKSHNSIPIWLHEGIAKFYESRWKGKAGEALSPYSEKLLADATRKKDFITYEQMHPSMALLPSQEAAALAFAEVFTTIEFLVSQHGNEGIRKVLSLTGEGMSLERSLKKAFGRDLKGIERAWRRYLAGRKFRIIPGAAPKPIRLASSEKEATKERALEKMDDRQVHDFSRLGELLQLRGHHKAAIVEYEKAYEKSGPRYATLVNRLAKAYVAVDQSSRALTVLDKVLQAHPENGDGHLLAGRIRFTTGDLDGAKKHFEAVRFLNPFNPEIHMALHAMFKQLGKEKEANQTQRFVELSRKPRPTRTYLLPEPPSGDAKVRVITKSWGQVRVAGRDAMSAPAWDIPVPSGEITIEYETSIGALKSTTARVGAGATETVVLSD